MAAPTQVYVNPAIAANSGSGTIGDPYGDLQYALNTMTRDAANGNRINIKAGTSEILTGTISYATYGTPNADAALVLQGYTSVAGDGGVGVIDGNAGNFSCTPATTAVSYRDLHFTNTGSATVLQLGYYAIAIHCEVSHGTSHGIDGVNEYNSCVGCNVHDISGEGIRRFQTIYGNYLKNGSTKKFTIAINGPADCAIVRNIVSVDGASNGISCILEQCSAHHNSVLSSSGTGYGIFSRGGFFLTLVTNNIVEGFSGAGGIGFKYQNSDRYQQHYNAAYNNTTNYDTVEAITEIDNEVTPSSPLAKSGSDTYANRLVYFAPVSTGNILSAWPNGAKGAVQPAASSGSSRRHAPFSGGISG